MWQNGYHKDETKGTWVKDHDYIWEMACTEVFAARVHCRCGKLFVHDTQEDFRQLVELGRDGEPGRDAEGKASEPE